MSDEEIRMTIAKSVGWKRIIGKTGYSPIQQKGGILSGEFADHWLAEIPDFCNDLNAMQDIEKTQGELYWKTLLDVCDRRGWMPMISFDPVRAIVLVGSATALQRCEAYLRTKGLWKDEAKGKG